MAHFQLEQELQAALKLDSTINFNTSSALNRSSRQNTKENPNGSAKKRAASAGRSNSSLLNGSLNRSRILGIQQPQALGTKRSTSTGRLVASPGRNGAKNRTTSPGRIGGDRFIPNRSTTDMENARYSLANSGDSFAGQTDSGDRSVNFRMTF